MLGFFRDFSVVYMAAGGPTSRLEHLVSEAGSRLGLKIEAYATPTGVFLTAEDFQSHESLTLIGRIRGQQHRLDRIVRLENMLRDLVDRTKLESSRAELALELKVPDPLWVKIGAAAAVGFAVAASRFEGLEVALASAFGTALLVAMARPLARRLNENAILMDFILSSIAVIFALLISSVSGVSLVGIISGPLLLLVPGLVITTAMSELAAQNFVSGTAKLMKGLFSLLALGLPYLLLRDFLHVLGIRLDQASTVILGSSLPLSWGWALAAHLVIVGGFCVIFSVPLRAMAGALASGLLGWLALRAGDAWLGTVLGPLVASFSVGLVSIAFARLLVVPSQCFSVPGVLALLPGLLALSSFESLALGSAEHGARFAIRVTVLSGTVVFGLLLAKIPFELFSPRYKNQAVEL